MKPEIVLNHEFVEYVPRDLKEGTIYISIAFATVIHKCCCGCGTKVVTPLSPAEWLLIFDGRSVSLYPSIGNWSFRCRSHYWMRNNRVIWARQWSSEEIKAGRRNDEFALDKYFGTPTPTADVTSPIAEKSSYEQAKVGRWERFMGWFRRK